MCTEKKSNRIHQYKYGRNSRKFFRCPARCLRLNGSRVWSSNLPPTLPEIPFAANFSIIPAYSFSKLDSNVPWLANNLWYIIAEKITINLQIHCLLARSTMSENLARKAREQKDLFSESNDTSSGRSTRVGECLSQSLLLHLNKMNYKVMNEFLCLFIRA